MKQIALCVAMGALRLGVWPAERCGTGQAGWSPSSVVALCEVISLQGGEAIEGNNSQAFSY
eukprot:1560434-Prymnesium_polylepis.1